MHRFQTFSLSGRIVWRTNVCLADCLLYSYYSCVTLCIWRGGKVNSLGQQWVQCIFAMSYTSCFQTSSRSYVFWCCSHLEITFCCFHGVYCIILRLVWFGVFPRKRYRFFRLCKLGIVLTFDFGFVFQVDSALSRFVLKFLFSVLFLPLQRSVHSFFQF